MKDIQFFKHNDGTVIAGFDEAVVYWTENCFDNDFEEISKEEYNDALYTEGEQDGN